MLQQIDIANVLFLDIETVSGHADFSELPEDLQALWAHKASNLLKGSDAPPTDEAIAESYRDRAAIYAEFGKIICISRCTTPRQRRQVARAPQILRWCR
ncbi:MAG: hypothetical protein R2795_15510 [Saprospiraceae bacterium]